MTDNDHPDRHLHAVPDADKPALIMPQIADMPGAYTVYRRPVYRVDASDAGVVTTPAAIVSRSGGDWMVMYGYRPDAPNPGMQWRADARLPWILGDLEAGRYAVDLADAYDLGVPGWHELLAAAMRAGELPLSITRLHAPVMFTREPAHASCRGENSPYDSTTWLSCPTVRVLAGGLGVTLPPDPDAD